MYKVSIYRKLAQAYEYLVLDKYLLRYDQNQLITIVSISLKAVSRTCCGLYVIIIILCEGF